MSYIEEIPEEKRKSRIMYGFLRKAGRGRIKVDHKRWCFLISSRPLNQDAYLEDSEEISDDVLPPLIEFDCMYYYEMLNSEDSTPCKGSIKSLEIDKLESKSEGRYHSMFIDAGPKKYEFMSTKKYVIQNWIEALQLAKRTASERQSSITGTIKNISKIVTEFEIDSDELGEKLKNEAKEKFHEDKDWDNLDEFLEECTTLSQEFFSIFDA